MQTIDLFAYSELAKSESISQSKVSKVTGFALKPEEENKGSGSNTGTSATADEAVGGASGAGSGVSASGTSSLSNRMSLSFVSSQPKASTNAAGAHEKNEF